MVPTIYPTEFSPPKTKATMPFVSLYEQSLTTIATSCLKVVVKQHLSLTISSHSKHHFFSGGDDPKKSRKEE
jgi:hypothetical protein